MKRTCEFVADRISSNFIKLFRLNDFLKMVKAALAELIVDYDLDPDNKEVSYRDIFIYIYIYIISINNHNLNLLSRILIIIID